MSNSWAPIMHSQAHYQQNNQNTREGPRGLITGQYFVKPLIALFGETIVIIRLAKCQLPPKTQIFSTNTAIVVPKVSKYCTANLLACIFAFCLEVSYSLQMGFFFN